MQTVVRISAYLISFLVALVRDFFWPVNLCSLGLKALL